MLSQEVSLGDCNDKVCDRTTMYFPLLNRYWDKVKITEIKNDLLSYCLMEGNCPAYAKVCFSKTTYRLYNLKNGTEVLPTAFFKKDETTQRKLDSIILNKLDYVPENMESIRMERQFYFEANKLFVFYDAYTIGGSEICSMELPYKEILKIADISGPIPVYFETKGGEKK